MASQPTERRVRRPALPGLRGEERRGWLSHGLAALAISALGLGIAGSIAVSTSAQPIAAPPPALIETAPQPAGVAGVSPIGAPLPETELQAPLPGTLVAYTRTQQVDQPSRSAQLRAAVVKERAAQRAEDLAKSAEQLSQAARDAGGVARGRELALTDRETRQTAVRIARERLIAAVRQRVAAEMERQTVANATPGGTATGLTGETAIGLTGGATTGNEPTVLPGGSSVSPVPGAVIGAHFGQYGIWARYHTGLDFRAGFGTPIKAVANGVVIYAGNSGDWAGNHVAIRHAGGLTSMSSHMSSMAVSPGQTVRAGQVIGYVGSTGRSFGAHLHFEVYPAGVRYGDVYRAVNPVPWLRSIGVRVN